MRRKAKLWNKSSIWVSRLIRVGGDLSRMKEEVERFYRETKINSENSKTNTVGMTSDCCRGVISSCCICTAVCTTSSPCCAPSCTHISFRRSQENVRPLDRERIYSERIRETLQQQKKLNSAAVTDITSLRNQLKNEKHKNNILDLQIRALTSDYDSLKTRLSDSSNTQSQLEETLNTQAGKLIELRHQNIILTRINDDCRTKLSNLDSLAKELSITRNEVPRINEGLFSGCK